MITVEIDETELKADWQSVKQALQALEAVDTKYGGALAKALQGIKQSFRKVMQDKVEADIMADFRNQLGL